VRTLLHVAARTLVERRLVLVAAGVAALLPLLAPLLPWTDRSDPSDARAAAALVIGAGLAFVVAVQFGTTCMARDLRERRTSFFLARPLPAASLWAGRILAGLLLSGATLLVVWLPPTLLDRTPSRSVLPAPAVTAALVAVLLVTIALSHAVAVMLSSRYPWLAIDVAALLSCTAAGAWLVRTIWATGAHNVSATATRCLVGAVVVSVLAAGFAQVVSGRCDARRGHRALSLTLWSSVAAALLALSAYAVFLTHPTPASLKRITSSHVTASDRHLVFSGESACRGDFSAEFMMDLGTGRFVRVKDAYRVVVSSAGTTAVWLEDLPGPGERSAQIMRCNLAGDLVVEATPLVVASGVSGKLALAPSGKRVAIQSEGLLAIHELTSGALVRSVRLPGGALWADIDFVSDSLVRVMQQVGGPDPGKAPRVVFALDLDRSTFVETGRLPASSAVAVGPWLKDARLILITIAGDSADRRLAVADAWTGATVAELGPLQRDPATYWRGSPVAPLSDGRYAVLESTPAASWIRVYESDWRPGRRLELGGLSVLGAGAEVEPGLLALAVWYRPGTQPGGWSSGGGCALLDLSTGAVTPVAEAARPLVADTWSTRERIVAPGTPAARLAFLPPGVLLQWDSASHRFRPFLGTGRR